jgi:hypothetical protein
MFRLSFARVLVASSIAAMLSVATAITADAQGSPQLRITAIANQGALRVGVNQFRVNVQNSSQAIPATGPVTVKLEVLDPYQVKSEFTATINGVAPGQDTYQTAWFRQVNLAKAGAYTVTAIVDPNGQFGNYVNNANRLTQVFTVPAANAATAYRLLVTVKNANGSVANGLRVSVKTAEGQELFWKMTAGTGQADFQKLAPSPADKPYTVTVTTGSIVKFTQLLLMPGQDHLLNIQLP